MFVLILLTIALLSGLTRVAYRAQRCHGLHTVPLHVTLYRSWCRAGEVQFYDSHLRHRLEAHGIVNIWDAGRWTLLITKPEYLSHIFRHERIVPKGGYHRKAPNTTVAKVFGENIIDSTGETWRHFTSIMKPGIQQKFSTAALRALAHKLITTIEEKQRLAGPCHGVVVNDIVQWWSTDSYGQLFLDADLGCLKNGTCRAQQAFRSIIETIPHPLLLDFPLLERILILFAPSIGRASQMADELFEALKEATANRPRGKRSQDTEGDQQDQLIYRLQQARIAGKLTDFHYRSNMIMMFIAGHENVKTLLTSTLFQLAQHPNVQQQLRQELVAVAGTHHSDHLKDMPYLTAVIYETLRLFPPLSQLTNRKTTEPVHLGAGITIPAGTWVGWNSYGVHTDPSNWGDDAREFKPERWGSDMQAVNQFMRTCQNRGVFIAFSAWSRMCIGAEFALLQMRVTLCEILTRFSITKDPDYQLALNEAAALEPQDCQLIFTPIEEDERLRR